MPGERRAVKRRGCRSTFGAVREPRDQESRIERVARAGRVVALDLRRGDIEPESIADTLAATQNGRATAAPLDDHDGSTRTSDVLEEG